jgi:hypothetical protein
VYYQMAQEEIVERQTARRRARPAEEDLWGIICDMWRPFICTCISGPFICMWGQFICMWGTMPCICMWGTIICICMRGPFICMWELFICICMWGTIICICMWGTIICICMWGTPHGRAARGACMPGRRGSQEQGSQNR